MTENIDRIVRIDRIGPDGPENAVLRGRSSDGADDDRPQDRPHENPIFDHENAGAVDADDAVDPLQDIYDPEQDPPAVNVPDGWSVDGWRRNLERMAAACEAGHPDKAADYRQQAAALQRYGLRTTKGRDNAGRTFSKATLATLQRIQRSCNIDLDLPGPGVPTCTERTDDPPSEGQKTG